MFIWPQSLRSAFAVAAALLLSLSAVSGLAETQFRRAQREFVDARIRFRNEPTNFAAAWHFARTCFDWAEFASDNEERETIANQGIDVCRRAISLQPKAVEGHYYLALNLGQLARTKTLGALKLVDEMETEFKLAREFDEQFDFGGPDRTLGLLYFEAPGWPTSIGSRSKARQHLERAAKLSPNYPENHLNLAEAYLKWGDKNGALREYKILKQLWPAAKKELIGERWESSWNDWDKRWEKIQAKFQDPPRLLEAPHQEK